MNLYNAVDFLIYVVYNFYLCGVWYRGRLAVYGFITREVRNIKPETVYVRGVFSVLGLPPPPFTFYPFVGFWGANYNNSRLRLPYCKND